MELSKKHSQISSSLTLAISAKAKKMQSEGADIISFSVGEPDFNTPKNIRDAAIKAIEEGKTGYTAASGLPELKNAIVDKLKRDNNIEYKPENIIISNGAKHSLYNTFQTICNEGDEVIVSAPYWVSYPELIKMAGGVPVIVNCEEKNNFKYNVNDLEKYINENTKAILLNSPSNPTGSVYSQDELESIAKIAKKHDLYIISDEIYEKLVYDSERHISIASIDEDIKNRTIVINGMSKAYAMTGWRIGYTASNLEIAKMMANIQSHATSNPNTIAQYASIEGLNGSQKAIEEMKDEFDSRRKFMVEKINEVEYLSCNTPKGAFYVMVNISKVIGKEFAGNKIENSMDLVNYLLDNAHVAVIPGVAFGADEYIRLSYANSLENIKNGIERIKNALA